MKIQFLGFFLLFAPGLNAAPSPAPVEQKDVFIRFKMIEPVNSKYYVQLGGRLLGDPWLLKPGFCPTDANTNPSARVKSGEFTPWCNVRDLLPAGARLISRREHDWRSGGVAEFPNITANFIAESNAPARKIVIELATAPDALHIVKSFEQSIPYSKACINISPDLIKDGAYLESADQMAERHLRWAGEATGGKANVPKKLVVVTSMDTERPDLSLKEAETLHLLGFNTLTCYENPVLDLFGFNAMAVGALGSSPNMDVTREDCVREAAATDRYAVALGKRLKEIGIMDELSCGRFAVGMKPPSAKVLADFRAWLVRRNVTPEFLGVKSLEEVMPMDTPQGFVSGAQLTDLHARRIYYLSCRYRQMATADRIQWLTEAAHQKFEKQGLKIQTQALTADHPFLGMTGMGYRKSGDWGESLGCDWFELARRPVADSLGIEDWLGLRYMYGPGYTWEGFQLLGFMADIFRSGARSAGRDEMPMMAWITPSNETNVRLKAASCLAHGVKNFYFWTYGPTYMGTENYWSDLRSEYDGIAAITRALKQGEDLLEPGRQRPTRLALFYSISSDIWQPFGYISMLERRLTYFSLTHDQYPLDMLTEEDVAAGRLAAYGALYVTDPCIATAAVAKISEWVQAGGHLYGSCAASSRDEYNEPQSGLSEVLGIEPGATFTQLPGSYGGRGGLGSINYTDKVQMIATSGGLEFGVIALKADVKASRTARVIGTFTNGQPAVIENHFGKGIARYIATNPAISYAKDAHYVATELKEKWPAVQRNVINQVAREAGIERPVELSSPVVETGLYDSPNGLALVLANYTYEAIPNLGVRVKQAEGVLSVVSVEHGPIPFKLGEDGTLCFTLPMYLNDLVLLRRTKE